MDVQSPSASRGPWYWYYISRGNGNPRLVPPERSSTCPLLLDHCGHPEFQSNDISAWQRDVSELAKRENLVIKVSEILVHAKSEDWRLEDVERTGRKTLDASCLKSKVVRVQLPDVSHHSSASWIRCAARTTSPSSGKHSSPTGRSYPISRMTLKTSV